MGQRLNLEIKQGEKVLANAYYHWAGYTGSALEHAQTALQYIKKHDDGKTDRLQFAVNVLEATGARLTQDEIDQLPVKLFKKVDATAANDRNEGLIAVSENGIGETQSWSEGDVRIDLEDRTVDFEAIWSYTADEYREDSDDLEKLPKKHMRFYDIPFDEFEGFAAELDVDHVFLNTDDNEVYGWIE